MVYPNKEMDEIMTLLSKVRTGKTRDSKDKPHKYLLLLSIISILENNNEHTNKFTFDELEPVFNKIIMEYYGNHTDVLLEYPFYHLQSDGIWTLRIKKGKEREYQEYEKTRLTKKRLLETVEYAIISERLFALLKNIDYRRMIKQSLKEMLDTSMKSSTVEIDFVKYLNTLSNASSNNENAITELNIQHPLFERIRVNNPITEEVWDQLQKGRHVILTGNAGDGKTMIAAEILDKFGRSSQIIQKRIDVEQANLIVVKDMSELTKEEKAALWQEILSSKDKSYLIVTNTGALLNSIQGVNVPWTRTDLLKALSAEGPQMLINSITVINIGRIDSIDTALEVFGKILDKRNWTQCDLCDAKNTCIIYDNVKTLRSNLPVVLDKLRLLYKRIYYYGTRLTMRQMIAHLAYAVTGLNTCSDMRNKLQLGDKGRFYNWVFGDDGFDEIPEAQQLEGVKAIKSSNLGLKNHPVLEAEIWERGSLPFVKDHAVRELIMQIKSKAIDNPKLSQKYRRQIRRLIYFCVPEKNDDIIKEFDAMFLESPMIKEYLDLVHNGPRTKLQKDELITCILLVLQEIFSGIRLPHRHEALEEIFISLSLPYLTAKSQYVLATINKKDFELTVTEKYRAGKTSNKVIRLTCKTGSANQCFLDIDLPFLDFVKRRFAGEISSQLSAHYINRITVFKNILIENTGRVSDADVRILRIGENRHLKVYEINIVGDDLEVSL